jgi:hypothetical protein
MDATSSRRRWFSAKRLVTTALLAMVSLVVWKAAAYPRGAVEAKIDVARGVYSIKTAGYPVRWSSIARQKLRERYGIEVKAEAGCEVTPWLEWYMDGYNSVSESAIKSKYGDDVISRAYEEARVEYINSLPESEREKWFPPKSK